VVSQRVYASYRSIKMCEKLKKTILCALFVARFCHAVPIRASEFKKLREQFARAVTTMQCESLMLGERQNACATAQDIVRTLRRLNKNSYALHLFFGFDFNGVTTTDISLSNEKLNAILEKFDDALSERRHSFHEASSVRELEAAQRRIRELEAQILIQQRIVISRGSVNGQR